MSLNSVSQKTFFEKINGQYQKKQKSQENAYDSFAGNLKEKAEEELEESPQREISENQTTAQIDYRYGKLATELLLQKTGRIEMNAVIESSVRHISYSESDYVKVCAAEGYTLKAQVEMTDHRVYIEQKNEDGTYQAYEVNPLQVSEDTDNPVEQMALEAWELARDLFNDGMFTELDEESVNKTQTAAENAGAAEDEEEVTFAEMVAKFEDFVKQRIKEGPPKIQIGGAEFSEEEWKRLLKKIDKDIDAYKEELRERVRKKQEESALKRVTGSAAEELEEIVNPGAAEEASEGVTVTERESLEVSQSEAPRGSSFLARLSGNKKAPYSYLADETGTIVYKGVTFVCDDKKQQICLGDMSDSKNVLNIPLAKGGCLRVNRDNLDDLVTAIGMFSPEDMARIMRALAQDVKVKEMELEIENNTI